MPGEGDLIIVLLLAGDRLGSWSLPLESSVEWYLWVASSLFHSGIIGSAGIRTLHREDG